MDEVLLKYLNSGNACLLVGSGPSTNMGYPSWRNLATSVWDHLRHNDAAAAAKCGAEALLGKRDFPGVFGAAERMLGPEQLLAFLRTRLVARSSESKLYEHLARWPIAVYLTTNYDDEIANHLARTGETYRQYDNSEAHIQVLTGNSRGIIYKLHGDLRQRDGLVLTTEDYARICESPAMQYWRTKMTSLFQMRDVVIIGHSLTDQNFRHVLDAARQGAGVDRPICWLAPDVSFETRKQYLDRHRIRVISYSNDDGGHSNLAKYVEMLTAFVYPRSSIRQSPAFQAVIASAETRHSAAAGLYVYTKASSSANSATIREEVIASALKGVQSKLCEQQRFSFEFALKLLKWPSDVALDENLVRQVSGRMCTDHLWVPVENEPNTFSATLIGKERVDAESGEFRHLQERFIESTVLRIRRNDSSINRAVAARVAQHLANAFIGFFREHGLTLASVLLASHGAEASQTIPSSLVPFLNQASLSLTEEKERHAFLFCAIGALTESGDAEREFLGRLAFGFAAFHILGVFGDVAAEKLRHVKTTMWLLDSNIQIMALARMSMGSDLILSTLSRLHSINVRLFSTERLALETTAHLRFAQKVIEKHGVNSPEMFAAATGEPPYDKSNAFLSGFLTWCAANRANDWEAYLYDIFGTHAPDNRDIVRSLEKLGIESLELEAWPGFEKDDFGHIEEIADRIQAHGPRESASPFGAMMGSTYRKALPEAQACVVVEHERDGRYNVLGRDGADRPAFFISDTSMLNEIVPGMRVTWPSDSYIQFVNTIVTPPGNEVAETSFETLLLIFAQYGKCLLNADQLRHVFAGAIDAAKMKIEEERETYNRHLAQKYGADPERAISRLPVAERPRAWAQLLEEMYQHKEGAQQELERVLAEESARVKSLEKKVQELEQFQAAAVTRRFRRARRRRQQRERATRRQKK